MYIASDRIFKSLLLYVSNKHKTDTKHAGLMVWGDNIIPDLWSDTLLLSSRTGLWSYWINSGLNSGWTWSVERVLTVQCCWGKNCANPTPWVNIGQVHQMIKRMKMGCQVPINFLFFFPFFLIIIFNVSFN